jgi:hypothetical protein
MIVYNVTVNIENDVHTEWLSWMKQKHIPDVMDTGYFKYHRILRLLGDEDTGGITYSIQYHCDKLEDYHNYQEKSAPALQKEHTEKFRDKFVAFRTLLEVVE